MPSWPEFCNNEFVPKVHGKANNLLFLPNFDELFSTQCLMMFPYSCELFLSTGTVDTVIKDGLKNHYDTQG